MGPANRKALQETQDAILVMHALAVELRQSLGPTDTESLPPSMAMLLMQLALAEVVRTASEEECDQRPKVAQSEPSELLPRYDD